MGKIKSAVFILLGLIIELMMFTSVLAWQVSLQGDMCVALGLILITLPFFNKRIRSLLGRHYKLIAIVFYIISAITVVFISIITVLMIIAMHDNKTPSNANVIVFGSSLKNGKPNDMLQYRCDVAIEYMKNHPKAICVVSGGLFYGYYEGDAMKVYMVSKGADANRIFAENKAENTSQNINFSKVFLGDNKNVMLATSDFHMLRSKFFAKQEGLNAYALPSKTPFNNLLEAWVREYMALIKAYVLKY
jgi:uncharacterized SAM-binding protein YcdF (DUF218 family)